MLHTTRLTRFLIGLVLALIVITTGFLIINRAAYTWGATPEELAQVLPGDELVSDPDLTWTHGITIHAPVEDVWPWIIQIGDTRAGFYSYMFIEKVFGADLYNNANVIHPEWQNPEIGQGVIADMVVLHSYEPNRYMLTQATEKMGGLAWWWLWYLTPQGEQTRLTIHMQIKAPETGSIPGAAGFILHNGGFIMEKGMLDGIKQRSEGRWEPLWIEWIEIPLWFAALVVGGIAGVRVVRYERRWLQTLAVGLAAVVALFVLTYLQPVIWQRAVIDLALAGGLWWAVSGSRSAARSAPAAAAAAQ